MLPIAPCEILLAIINIEEILLCGVVFGTFLVGRVGADPTTPNKTETVLQTAEFADSLYLPILNLTHFYVQ